MTEPWRPGLNVVRMHGLPSWTPCLTRTLDEEFRPTAREHAWFLDVTSTLYCWECRRGRARTVVGPAARIAEIRAALDAGDRVLVAELVQRLAWTTAPPVNDREVPAATSCAEPVNILTEPGLLLTRHRRVDCIDVDAVDFVYERCFETRDPDDWAEFFAERAAMFEFLGGYPRQVAESKARQLSGPPPRSRHDQGVTMARAG